MGSKRLSFLMQIMTPLELWGSLGLKSWLASQTICLLLWLPR
ncbi:unnamed protein product [Linum tenue]|uniref:Uncharacterized protein n=1 Tax=Linum tenue TaxID=586396 RepID=A0AAV0S5I7_9ROSI|nr:unnamed protein product [Linum tenue]